MDTNDHKRTPTKAGRYLKDLGGNPAMWTANRKDINTLYLPFLL